jgi:hypothetical protein
MSKFIIMSGLSAALLAGSFGLAEAQTGGRRRRRDAHGAQDHRRSHGSHNDHRSHNRPRLCDHDYGSRDYNHHSCNDGHGSCDYDHTTARKTKTALRARRRRVRTAKTPSASNCG